MYPNVLLRRNESEHASPFSKQINWNKVSQIEERPERGGETARQSNCWNTEVLTSLCHSQMHIVHFNADKYANISMAVDKSDGLAVLGALVEVRHDAETTWPWYHDMSLIQNGRGYENEWRWLILLLSSGGRVQPGLWPVYKVHQRYQIQGWVQRDTDLQLTHVYETPTSQATSEIASYI